MTVLNGWRRLGLVMTGFWFAGVAALGAYEGISRKDGYFVGLTLPMGTLVVGNRAKLPDGRMVELHIVIEGRAIKPWEIQWDDEPEVPIEQVVHWSRLLFMLAAPFLFWVSAEFIVFICRWVSSGFRAGRTL